MANSPPIRYGISRITAGAALPVLLFLMVGMLALSFGCTEQRADDGTAIDAPRSQPTLFAQALVQQAIDRYEKDGREETIDFYNSEESTDGDWYVFILDEEGYIIALAPLPDWVGVHDSEFKGPNEYPVGQMVIDSAGQEGIQIGFLANDSFGGAQLRHSWIIKHDGLIFGSSTWSGGPRRKSDQPAYTQEYVQQAINLYEGSGRDAAVTYYNDPVSVDGQWYIFIADESGRLIAHGANQDLVGMPLVDVVGSNGYPSGRIIADDADEDGEWSDYVFYNPATGRSQIKHSWVVAHDGLIFGSGWYEDGPRKSEQPAYTQTLVQQALNLYDSSGLDVAVSYYNDPVSVDAEWYVVIIDTATGRTISHYRPEIRDRDPSERIDSTGYFYGDELLAAQEDGRWVRYTFREPSTGEERQKHTWAVLHDGYIFSSGWYE